MIIRNIVLNKTVLNLVKTTIEGKTMCSKKSLGKSIVFIFLGTIMIFFFSNSSQAQLYRFSFALGGGAGYVSLDDWEDLFSSITMSHYQREKLGTFLEARVAYHLTDKHAIALNVENISISAFLCGAMPLGSYTPPPEDHACYVDQWDFSATPIGLSYEFFPLGHQEKISPFLGTGASYFFSKVVAKSHFLNNGRFEGLDSLVCRDSV
jgi:hypothetical protein